MSFVTCGCVAGAAGALAVVLGYLARAACLRRSGRDSLSTHEGLAAAGALLVPAATVLLLSWLALMLGRFNGGLLAWASAQDTLLRAWFAFWWLVLLIDGCESALRVIYALRRRTFPMPRLIRNLLRAALVAGALLLVANGILGRDISTALASTALLTAVVGFALQGVLGNLLAGLSMHVVRSTVPGDWVAVGELEGEVVETNWRETRLQTVGGHLLVVPNSKMAESVIHNMTHPTPVRRIVLSLEASYSDAPADVVSALESSALSVPDVLRAPPPQAVLVQYMEFGVKYELRVWTDRYYDRAKLISDVLSRVWYQFKRRGIEIPFPMSDKLLFDFMEVIQHQRRLPPGDADAERRLGELKRSDFYRLLPLDEQGCPLVGDEALLPVVRMMRRVRYTRGEVLFRQGDAGESAYVVVSGSVDGRVEFEAGIAPHAFTAGPGALLGEMSLMTGLPRTATLVAADEAELLEIPRDAFVRLLGVRPDIPGRLAELSALRAAQNAATYDQLKSMPPRAGLTASLQQASILTRFRRMLAQGVSVVVRSGAAVVD